ncbi:hypothetical protein [Anatilimnocola floriformis]|uniref:hypothetical protein n=1 Tax=Anatilimnocola floriformis TaxID=2948575 RepID=UPI0020C22183|nr:hypothetical protein [Anatilimnocola floriformis]
MHNSRNTAAYGLAAISFFLLHGGYQLVHGRWENLLWACHLADLIVGVGLVLRSRSIAAMGLVMLGFGVPMWLVSLATGGDFYPTSILTHLGGMSVGIVGLKRLGGLRDDWWRAYLLVLTLVVVSHFYTTASLNVNMAFNTWSFARPWITSLSWHLLSLLAVWAAGLYVAEQCLRRTVLRSSLA